MTLNRDAVGEGAASSTLLNGLLYRWSFNEESGTRADSVDAADLTDNNTVGFGVGKNGNAASFVSGNNETLTKASFETGLTTAATWVLWLNPTDFANFRAPLTKWAYQTDGEWIIDLEQTNGKIRIYIANALNDAGNNFVTTTEALTAGVWTNVIITYDGSLAAANRVAIYFDDVAATLTVNGTIAASLQSSASAALTFGNVTSGLAWSYNGLIDEPLIYSRVLTAAERTLLYNAGAGNYWPFTGLP